MRRYKFENYVETAWNLLITYTDVTDYFCDCNCRLQLSLASLTFSCVDCGIVLIPTGVEKDSLNVLDVRIKGKNFCRKITYNNTGIDASNVEEGV